MSRSALCTTCTTARFRAPTLRMQLVIKATRRYVEAVDCRWRCLGFQRLFQNLQMGEKALYRSLRIGGVEGDFSARNERYGQFPCSL